VLSANAIGISWRRADQFGQDIKEDLLRKVSADDVVGVPNTVRLPG
jgi:hypothetical protein